MVRAQARVQRVHQGQIVGVVEALILGQQSGLHQQPLDPCHAVLGQVNLAGFLVEREIARAFLFFLDIEIRHDSVDLDVQLGAFVGRTGDDQRCSGLVDQNGIDLVDDRKVLLALHLLLQRKGHVVAQIVESELVVGAVGDVAGVGCPFGGRIHAGNGHAHGHVQRLVDRLHPGRIAARQVVVDRHHVNAPGRQRVEINGQRRDQGLAFAGLHFGDLALVQHHAADHLGVKMAHAQRSNRGFANHRERLWQKVIKSFTVFQALAEFNRLRLELVIIELLGLCLELVDPVNIPAELLEQPLVAATNQLRYQAFKHKILLPC